MRSKTRFQFKVSKLMQKNKSGITFLLDESMVDYIESRTVFELEVEQDNEDGASITLVEQTV